MEKKYKYEKHIRQYGITKDYFSIGWVNCSFWECVKCWLAGYSVRKIKK